jgi:hypothetical protein
MPEELISETAEWFARRMAGLEDAIARYVVIGIFPEEFLTTQTSITGCTEMSKFTR